MSVTDLGALALVIAIVAFILGVIRAEHHRMRSDHWLAEYTRVTSELQHQRRSHPARRPSVSIVREGGGLLRRRRRTSGNGGDTVTRRRQRGIPTITRELSCDDKKRFSARSARRLARDRGDKYGETLHAYPCRFCRHWHIGHPTFKSASHG